MSKKRISLLLYILVISLALIGCTDTFYENEDYEGKLAIHFIDVGQGDSTLIQFPNGEVSLIDGGTRNNGEKVVEYLQKLRIKKIDYLIATHPHEDHIGGLPKVVKNFEIGKVYMPNKTANTRIFEELLSEIDNKGLKITLAKGGDTIIDEGQLKYTVLAPNREDYDNTNNFSIVTKVKYKNNSFIVTGDAEKESELEMLQGNYDLKANVLRVGHHGSSTSSIDEFIEEVDPEHAVISLGKDNTYGHPHTEIVDKFSKMEINILRTDELGNIVFISDGSKIELVNAVDFPNGNVENNDLETGKYIGNVNTKIVHTKDCGSLPKKENQIMFDSLEEALKNGYKPHEKCVK